MKNHAVHFLPKKSPPPLRGGLGRGAADKSTPASTSPHPSSPARGEGFSLVELSIVLVILGLLVGGILAGQSLIRASELRQVSAGKQNYETAINTFRDKYFARPGDFVQAKSFWPSTCVDGTNNACNGNGDGVVTAGCVGGYLEGMRAWQHLNLAGLIEGDYALFNGVTCSTTYSYGRPGSTVPALKIGKAGLIYFECQANSTCQYHTREHVFRLGEQYSDSLEDGFLTPDEAWNIDTKLDDGRANTGTVTGITGHTALGQTNCLVANAYNLGFGEQHCGLVIDAP